MGQVHLGATTGYNATFVLDQGLSKDPRYNSTYTYNWSPYGVSLGFDLGRTFGFQFESILSNQGQIYNVINTAKEVAGSRQIDLQYINLPLLLKFMNGSSRKVRSNFNIGPQLSILTKGVESLTTKAGTYQIPEGVDFAEIQEEYSNAEPVNNGDGTYTLGKDVPTTELLTKEANEFKDKEFQLAAAFGLDIDLSKHLFLTMQVRANYSLTDMRNEDIINNLKSGNYSEIFGNRANCIVGVQMGLHYYFGQLRSFR
jgi:hypothetical protein